jgi:Flp pilus assembly protein TadD
MFVSSTLPPRGNPDSHYILACYYQERGRHKEAIGEFNKVIVIDPLHVKAYNGLGVSYSELKEHQKAVDAFLTALKIDPKLDYVQNNLGYSFLLQGDMSAAIDAFKKATALNSGSSRIHNNLGIAYAMTGNAEKAREEFKIGGGDAWTVYNMAQLYYQNDMFYEAREHFAKALDMNPSLAEARKGWDASDTLYRISQALSAKAEDFGDSAIDYTIQVGAFSNVENAARLTGLLRERGLEAIYYVDPAGRYRVHFGNFSSKMIARNKSEGLKSSGVINEYYIENFHHKLGAAKNEVSLTERADGAKRVDSMKWLQKVEIEISNGNGVRNMAKSMGSYLKKRGFKVVRFTNANHFNYRKGNITYSKKYYNAAKAVAREIPQMNDLKMVAGHHRDDVKIKVLMGKDLVPYSKLYKDDRS